MPDFLIQALLWSRYIFPLGSMFFHVIQGNSVFNYNLDQGYKHGTVDKNARLMASWAENPVWSLEQHWHRLLGWCFTFIAYWLLVDRIIGFSSNKIALGFPDLFLFLIAFVGLNGRLPTLAHSVQDWLRSTK